MKIFLLGKGASITHWLEDAAAAFAGEGHEVAMGLVRRPWLAAPLEAALAGPIAARLRRRIIRQAPDLILALGAFHVPAPILEAIERRDAELASRLMTDHLTDARDLLLHNRKVQTTRQLRDHLASAPSVRSRGTCLKASMAR